MECAQCHDHKYDPISQKEYYQFYAYFNINSDAGNQTRNGNSAPMVKVPSMAESAELQQRRDKVAAAKSERAKAKPSAQEMDEWIADHRASELPQPPKLGGWQFLGSFTGKNKDAAFKKGLGAGEESGLGQGARRQKMGAARVRGRQGAHRRSSRRTARLIFIAP